MVLEEGQGPGPEEEQSHGDDGLELAGDKQAAVSDEFGGLKTPDENDDVDIFSFQINKSRGYHSNDDYSVALIRAAEEALETKEKQKPSFELSGTLAGETNRVEGLMLLPPREPPDAQLPDKRWTLKVFEGGQVLNEPLNVHCQTRYLFGSTRGEPDIPIDHSSCSNRHAVLQYRKLEKELPFLPSLKEVRPFLMDLGSTSGTFLNDTAIGPLCYYELRENDTIKFGNSSRYYVLHENSPG